MRTETGPQMLILGRDMDVRTLPLEGAAKIKLKRVLLYSWASASDNRETPHTPGPPPPDPPTGVWGAAAPQDHFFRGLSEAGASQGETTKSFSFLI